ncbi:MAG TPA: methyltransferase domain-containing protein [Pyrinomonadaceae bacterium]|jgi:methylase of polypeptide subunit release factors|nr:methyltransferase domain-containing protein [Pyrinomonadaceae bacterium]
MRYYRPSEDWITNLEGPHREPFAATLRGLGLERLQKYPPPKLGGLPLGNETRILKRYLKGESSQLDASALSSFYLRSASARDKLLYSAFRRNDHLSREQWADIIGAERVDKWLRHKFLRETLSSEGEGKFVCKFSIVVLDGLLMLVDPLNDHGNQHETVMLPEDFLPAENDNDVAPFNHTYIGLDSLRQIEIMAESDLPVSGGNLGSYLDCGVGAGAILLSITKKARGFNASIGVDINPRAAMLAQFNAELNNLTNVRVYGDDALKLGGRYGKFDLVSWNLPFLFFPEEYADSAVDAFGGEMGIGLCLDFIETVPGLLTENGVTCIAALSPILNSGENVLETKLKERLGRLRLDCTVRVAQVSLAHNREMWHFHQSHNIRKFESVYLFLRPGGGKLKRIEAGVTRRALDVIREKMYRRKFS